MGNEISDRKNKRKPEAPLNERDGAGNKEDGDQTGSFNGCLTFTSTLVC